MIRSGLVRQIAAGAYAYLPLGFRVLQKVTQIVREEMNRAGAIELHMPAIQPLELWQETSRDQAMGDTMVYLTDKPFRKATVLGPTHEEVITEIVRAYISSYKRLPITMYQIQTKFRDEARPKSGILRTREFLMKDCYSFHTSKESLDATYEVMYEAYCRIFRRCGLPYTPVEADSGPIGGDASHEFMVPTEAGEDYMVRAIDGSYAANLERAVTLPIEDAGCDAMDELKEVHTPGQTTIDEVSEFLGCKQSDMIKTLVYQADDEVIIALVRGDHDVNEGKLGKLVKAKRIELATPETIEKVTGAPVGFAGPVGLQGVRIIADQAVTVMHNAVTGANKGEYHITGVNPGRDFEIKESADIRFAMPDDKAPNGQPVTFDKCIEVGHVFKLGTKYSDAMKATYLDENGKSKSVIMGCYGIGVNRIMAAAIEASHDDNGIIWPINIAPFTVHIVALDHREKEVIDAATKLHDELESAGIDVLMDDRDARPGFKFKDADLIGIPIRVTIGKRGLAEGIVEFKQRNSDEVQKIAPEKVMETIEKILDAS